MKSEFCKCAAAAATAALLASAANAFELGAADADIYAATGHETLAKELSEYLGKVFGKSFPVKAMPGEITADLAGIFVGAKPPDCDVTWDESRECCVRIVEPSRVWLFGNDKGKLLNGTADAVYDFLERFAGVRWLWPGEIGTVADPSGPVVLKEEKSVYVTPFRKRLKDCFFPTGMPPSTIRDFHAWIRHRHTGSSLAARGSGFQHSFKSLLPRNVYGKEHPEYYALVSPERWVGDPKPTKPTRVSDPMMTGSWQLCTSNPDVRRIIAEKLIANNTTAIQSISPNDGLCFCECDACRAQDPEGQGIGDGVYNITDRMYDFLNDIAWQVYKASPKSKVGLFSYSHYASAPSRKFDLPPNVYLSCCYKVYDRGPKEEEELERRLRGIAATGANILGREYWGTHYTMRYPISHSRKFDRNLKLLRDLGAAGVYGNPGTDFAVRASDLYLLSALAWNPSVDREETLRDFCAKGFGDKAGEVMFDLFEAIEDRVESKIAAYPESHSEIFKTNYPNKYAEFNRYQTTIFDADFSEMCDRETKKALKLADTPERRKRVEYIASGLNFAKVVTDALLSFEDLADIGCDMSLTQPSGKEIKMEKATLLAVVNKAIDAESARRRYSDVYRGSNALSSDRRSEALSLRPWGTMAARARLLLRSDRFNYLVNGAFEYSGFSWEVTGDGTNRYTTVRNHDADDNWMVQCHAGQGISLELTVAPGGEMKVRQLRKVSPATPVEARLRLFARCDGEPLAEISASLGGCELKAFDIGATIPENDNWHELRFLPATVPAGDHEFVITVKNPGDQPLTVNLDDLNLRLRP
jgi:hypothetical protein